MNMRTLATVYVIGLGLAVLAGSSQAAESTPCTPDIEKFCKDAKDGMAGSVKCLNEHQAELSEACKKHRETLRAQLQANRQAGLKLVRACKSDIDKFCKGVKPGGGRVADCLKKNGSKLSAPCKTALAEAPAKH